MANSIEKYVAPPQNTASDAPKPKAEPKTKSAKPEYSAFAGKGTPNYGGFSSKKSRFQYDPNRGQLWIIAFLALFLSTLSAFAIHYYVWRPSYDYFNQEQRVRIERTKNELGVKIIHLDKNYAKKGKQASPDSGRNGNQPNNPQPTPTPNKPIPAPADKNLGDALSRNFSWNFRQKNYQTMVVLDKNVLNAYQKPVFLGDMNSYYQDFLTTAPNDDVAKQIVTSLRTQAKANGLSDNDLAELILSFVQNAISYDDAKATVPGIQPDRPYKTIADKSGLCADKALLSCALLNEAGFGSCVILMSEIGHAAAGLAVNSGTGLNGSTWAYFETTTPNSPIGTLPIWDKRQRKLDGQINSRNSNAANLGSIQFIVTKTGKQWQANRAA